jgi:hypothetical protein
MESEKKFQSIAFVLFNKILLILQQLQTRRMAAF